MSQMNHKESYRKVIGIYCTVDILVINVESNKKLLITFGISLSQLHATLRSITY